MPVPTLRLVLVAAVASLIVLAVPWRAPLGLFAVDGALILLALADSTLAPSPGSVKVDRSLPATLTLGAEAEVGWQIRNPTARRLHVGVSDEIAPSLHPGARRFRLTIPARGSLRAHTTIRPERRGHFTPSEIVVRVDGPMRLGARQGRRALPGALRVLPKFRSWAEAELRINRARVLEVGLRSAQGRGGGTEFEALREYSVDDEYRRIDWAATARAARPIVRTYRAERNQNVLIFLDTGRLMAARVDRVPRLDHALDATMMLTAVATRLGDRVGLIAFDREVRAVIPPGQSTGQLRRVTDTLYRLEPRLVETDYLGAFAEATARFKRRALWVVLSDLGDESLSESLLPALPLIARHHLVIVAGVTDPDVARWATATPTETGTAYRKAAAIGFLEARRRAASMLRMRGAAVVDASPGRLSTALADAYLTIKATGRL